MTRDETLAYGRGYNAGAARKWPAHKPPVPPEPVVAELMRALTALRDKYDAMLATMGPDPELEAEFGPAIDAADAATAKVTEWLLMREIA